MVCQEVVAATRSFLACNHFPLCESCASKESHICPMCRMSSSNKYVSNGNNNIASNSKSVISS